MRTALILLAIALALPSALAQLPVPTTPCGPIAITAPTAPPPVAPGTPVDLAVAVANNGQIATTVTVTASVSGAGWTLGAAPASAAVASSSTGTFTFQLTPSEAADANADVTFSASGVCNEQLQVCPAQACQTGPQVAQVRVPLAGDDGFSFPFLDSLNVPLELLIAAIVLIGLASAIPFLMRRQKGGIVAQCPEPLKMVKPGRGTSFPIELKNGTKDAATAQFEVGPVPEGWSAFMPLPEVQLAAREARSLWLMVRSPQTAAQGDVVDVELRLKDPAGKDNGVVRVRAEVQGSAEA